MISNTAKENLLRFTRSNEDDGFNLNADSHFQAILGVINELDRNDQGRLTDPLKMSIERALSTGRQVLNWRQLESLTNAALNALAKAEQAQEYQEQYPDRIFILEDLAGLDPDNFQRGSQILITQYDDPKVFSVDLSCEPRDLDKSHLPELLGITLLDAESNREVPSHNDELHSIVTYCATVQGKSAHIVKDWIIHSRLDPNYTITFNNESDAAAFKYSLQALIEIQNTPDAIAYRESVRMSGSKDILLGLGIARQPNKQTIEANLGELKLNWQDYKRASAHEWQSLVDISHQHGMTMQKLQNEVEGFWLRVRARAESKM
jgi:hypothetical protein